MIKSSRLLALLLLALGACTTTQPVAPPPPTATPAPTPAAPPPAPEVPDAPEPVPPLDWHLRAATTAYPGVGVEEAYALVASKTPTPVVVAVIDSGVDIEHEDLDGRIWTNEDEIPGNGVDDDQNGYVDDVHGWNFLGNAQGQNAPAEQYEVTREYVRLRPKYERMRAADVSEADRDEYAYFVQVRDEYRERLAEAQGTLPQIKNVYDVARKAVPRIHQHFGRENVTERDLLTIGEGDRELAQARNVYAFLLANGLTLDDLKAFYDQLYSQVNYHFNADYDGRANVDDTDDPAFRTYGNGDVEGPDPDHGTHVAGIIAARRDNTLGGKGIADAVRIMSVRAVPNGDERDKDVANAIRYATDNGARIINMSFGKGYSPQRALVDEAIRYATAKGVLLVHAAGNNGADSDVEANFPSAFAADGTPASTTWIGVGASNWETETLAASFSNYGQTRVDLFAPGVAVYATLPDNTYGPNDGTSMAAPVVTGVAALVLSYYPDLTAAQLRQVLVESARRYEGSVVVQPGTEDEVDFCTLSVTCGVVDAEAAMRMAAQLVGDTPGR